MGRLTTNGSKPNAPRLDSVEVSEFAACGRSGVGCACEATSKEVEVNPKQVNGAMQDAEANSENANSAPREVEVKPQYSNYPLEEVGVKTEEVNNRGSGKVNPHSLELMNW